MSGRSSGRRIEPSEGLGVVSAWNAAWRSERNALRFESPGSWLEAEGSVFSTSCTETDGFTVVGGGGPSAGNLGTDMDMSMTKKLSSSVSPSQSSLRSSEISVGSNSEHTSHSLKKLLNRRCPLPYNVNMSSTLVRGTWVRIRCLPSTASQ